MRHCQDTDNRRPHTRHTKGDEVDYDYAKKTHYDVDEGEWVDMRSPNQLAALWSVSAIQSDPDFLLDSMVRRPRIREPASARSGLTSGSVIKL